MRFRPALSPSAGRSRIAARLCIVEHRISQARFSLDGKNRREAEAAAGFGARVFARFIRGDDAENSESGPAEAGRRLLIGRISR